MTKRILLVLAGLIALHVSVVAAQDTPPESTPPAPKAGIDVDAVFDQAVAKLRSGEASAGILLMRDAVARIEKGTGTNSPAHAKALFKLATVYIAASDLSSAASTLQQCCNVVPTDRQSQMDRLTYQMNLGEIYIYLERFDLAEQVLRDSLKEREAFYGTRHAGYAYGLQPLARLLLTQGKAKDALPLITQARDICLISETPLTPTAFADRIYVVMAAGGTEDEAWGRTDELPAASRTEMYRHAALVSENLQGSYVIKALDSIIRRVDGDPQADENLRRTERLMLVNAARREKDYASWIRALDGLQQAAEKRNDTKELVNLYQNKALAYEQSNDFAGAERSYGAALDGAMKTENPAMISEVQRNFGLYFSEQKKKDDADKHLSAAVEYARKADHKPTLGAALAAYGIFVQHNGDLIRGRALLEEATAVLSPSDRNFLFAQNHLNAIVQNQACGCGDMSGAIVDAIRKLVRQRLPEDLVEDVLVTIKDKQPDVSVKLKRKPTDGEMDKVNVVIKQALVELRTNMKQP